MSDPNNDPRQAEQQAHFTQAHIDIAVLKVVVESLSKDVQTMGVQVGELTKLLSEAKGGWKVIAAVSGVAGVLGSALSWFVAHLGMFKQ